MKNNWHKQGSNFYHREVTDQTDKLPKGVFLLQQIPLTGELYLTKLEEEFTLPKKIYGGNKKFVDRVVKTYNNTEGNLGILMNGVKGTGKTVTSKMISNSLGLPVIIIKEDFDNIPEFLNSLQENVVVFFDEYEKIYDNRNNDILTVMDGVLSNQWRKVFLLTTNNPWVNDNMLQRPGRIRYYITFGDLLADEIIEIVDDLLKKTDLRDEVIRFISGLEIITVDIVSSVVEEVNIHEEVPETFKEVFNVKPIDNCFNVYTTDGEDEERLLYESVQVSPSKISKSNKRTTFRIDGEDMGYIIDSIGERGYKVRDRYSSSSDGKPTETIYVLERDSGLHRSFHSFAF